MQAVSNTLFDTYRLPAQDDNADKAELGQDEFMQLMLTQLRYQDPFKPLENGEFIAQMAQFSTVAGIDELGASLQTLVADQVAAQTMQAAGLLGRSAVISGSIAVLEDEQGIDMEFEIPHSSSAVTATINNQNGTLVHTMDLGEMAPGNYPLHWDGSTDAGIAAAPGSYAISVQYRTADGSSAAADTFNTTRITSINLQPNSNSPTLSTSDGREISLSDVRKIL